MAADRNSVQVTPFLIGFYGLFFIGGMVWTLQDGLTQMNLNHSPQAWIWCSFLGVLPATFMVTLMFVPLTEAAMYLCIFIRGNPLGFGWEGWTGSWLGRIIASQEPPLPAACYEMRRIQPDDRCGDRRTKCVFETAAQFAVWKPHRRSRSGRLDEAANGAGQQQGLSCE